MAIAVEWVVAAQSGDAEAFGRLARAELPAAYRLALSIVRSPAEAEDAVQDAFLRAWRDVGQLRSADLWPAWFRRLTVRAAIDQTRRRRVRVVDIEAAEEQAAADDLGLVADRLALTAGFGRLRAEDRAIIALRFLEDLEVPDVAASLGIPLGTAKSRLHRALRRLEDEMRRQT